MKVNDLLYLIPEQGDVVDVYTATESEWHMSLFEGPAGFCPNELRDKDVLSIWTANSDEPDQYPVLCIGIGASQLGLPSRRSR